MSLSSRVIDFARSTHLLAASAFGFVALAHYVAGAPPYTYGVCYVLVFILVGMTHGPGTSIKLAPVAVAAYAVPVLGPHHEPVVALTASVAVPVGVLVGEILSRRTAALQAARDRTIHQSALMTAVAEAARSVHSLKPPRVLEEVVRTTRVMGFEAAEICTFDEQTSTWRSVMSTGLPEEYIGVDIPITLGLAGRVWDGRATVVARDYSALSYAIPTIQEAGFRVAIAAPIWCNGRLEAALIAGTRTRPSINEQDVDAFELLAEQASRALENARRFEKESEAVRKMAELDALKGDFISNVSHELRTPLAIIFGLGQTLSQKWDALDDGVKQDLLGRLNANAQVLDRIIANLLDFSRLEAGQVEARFDYVDIGRLARAASIRLKGLFENHPLTVSAPSGWIVQADGHLLDRVIENLLSNAVNHTPAGTAVELVVRREKDRVIVAVQDEGPGIPTEDMPNIGERFFRGGRRGRRSRGTGLGLALVTQLLGMHDSKLDAANAPGAGANFSFALPLAADGNRASRRPYAFSA